MIFKVMRIPARPEKLLYEQLIDSKPKGISPKMREKNKQKETKGGRKKVYRYNNRRYYIVL